jgi:Ca-activated chloride channel family protein
MPTRRYFLLAALFLILFISIPSLAQDDDVVTVDSSIVVLNAAITDATGRHVPGLRKAQFTVLENGVEQEITTFEAEETPFAAVILLDTSASMEQRVTLAALGPRSGFSTGCARTTTRRSNRFDSKVSLVQKFSNSRDVVEKIFDLKADGMTALNDAVYKAAVDLSTREEKRRAIIVLSDGMDTISARSADKA